MTIIQLSNARAWDAVVAARINPCAATMTELRDALRAKLRHNLGLGKHDGATVYEVKPVKVKSYTRRGYTAVRCR